MSRPLILVTNDDGVFAKGIKCLVDVAKEFGDVVVISPDSPQSGMGHAITINHPLRLAKSSLFDGVEAYSCTGTPVDCVKLGIYEVLHQKPDLVLSGINHGANTSTNVLYSGTMSAAIEGALEGIPSVGFSLYDYDSDADFSVAMEVVREVLNKHSSWEIPSTTCLNVNVPKIHAAQFRGIKFCRQGHALWADSFDKRLDQFKRPYYWLTGDFSGEDESEDTDLFAIANGYASIVPTQFDLTNHQIVSRLNNLNQ